MTREKIYTMDVETDNENYQHPFHLGTDRNVALSFVSEQLARDDVKSVALRYDGKVDTIFHGHEISVVTDAAYDCGGQES